MLGTPMSCLEQRLNADAIERMGVGMQVPPRRVTAEVVQRFLAREAEFVAKFHGSSRDGAKEALEAVERFAAELTERISTGEKA
jgi:UDP:flavonoid glycosyltransferase YjiC (YdhE family)